MQKYKKIIKNMKNDNLQPKDKIKIVIALIHNNDENRLTYIKPKINALIIELQKEMSVDFFEVSWQPDLKPVKLRTAFFRDVMYWKLDREWNRYKKTKNNFFLIDFQSIVKNSIRKYFLNSDVARRWARACAIEMYVTDKHLRAFSGALECRADYLLCFEDDAVFMEYSIRNVVRSLNDLKNRPNEIPIYIDLAGGCQLKDIKIGKLESKRDGNFIYYSKSVTNTACCYLTNRVQLENFMYFLTRHPLLRYVGIDWCMNKLFMLQSKHGSKSDCFHAYPHFFKHGSVTGECKPWER